MSAQPVPAGPSWPGPDPRRQRLANHTVEDVLALPGTAPRVELARGAMVVPPPAPIRHEETVSLLGLWLHQHCPPDLTPVLGAGLALGLRDTIEPDLMLLLTERMAADHHYATPEQVIMAVEVVAAATKRRDRFERPEAYAAAGVPLFWRVELDPVHVHVYQLGDDGYALVAGATDELVLDRPFGIRLQISDITP